MNKQCFSSCLTSEILPPEQKDWWLTSGTRGWKNERGHRSAVQGLLMLHWENGRALRKCTAEFICNRLDEIEAAPQAVQCGLGHCRAYSGGASWDSSQILHCSNPCRAFAAAGSWNWECYVRGWGALQNLSLTLISMDWGWGWAGTLPTEASLSLSVRSHQYNYAKVCERGLKGWLS